VLGFGPAAAVQSLAWVGMLAVRSAERGVDAAVRSTFGGAEPCRMCVAAASLRQQGDGMPAVERRDAGVFKQIADPSPWLAHLPPSRSEPVRPGAQRRPELMPAAPEPPPPQLG
jgi:hypothetical protein